MAGISITRAADQLRADTAGVTGPIHDPGLPAASSLAPNVFTSVRSDLGFLGGGPHPTGFLSHVSTALVNATDSLRGPNGGAVPRTTGTQAPGPAGGTATAANIDALRHHGVRTGQPVGGGQHRYPVTSLGDATNHPIWSGIRTRLSTILKGA